MENTIYHININNTIKYISEKCNIFMKIFVSLLFRLYINNKETYFSYQSEKKLFFIKF